MKQTQRLALRVAARRQRHSALVTGQRHVDEIALAPIERIRIRREYEITPAFKQAIEEAGVGKAVLRELDAMMWGR